MQAVENLAKTIWHNTWIHEFVLFLVTTLVIVITAQLSTFDSLFDNGISLDEVKVWFEGALTTVLLTVIRQGVAWIVAHGAGTKL